MYLEVTDLIAVMIALVVSATLVITSALHNARLQQRIDYLRKERHLVTQSYESILKDLEQ